MRRLLAAAALLIFPLLPHALWAQDTRHVTEPVIPPSCTVVSAALHATDNALAEADDARPDTERIQNALNHCGTGRAVELKASGANNAFLSGPPDLREGVTLLVDKGVTLYASRNPRDFDTVPGGCGAVGAAMKPCRALININVKDAAVMGDGAIDGRGDRVMLGKAMTWWQQSRAALNGDTNGQGLKYSAPRLIAARNADGLILYRIKLHNAPNFHVTVNNTDGFLAWGVHLLTPTVRGTDARNTDGIDPGSSQNVTIAKSWIDNGDDNIAIKAGVRHMSVLDNHFYCGHGMSMGSEARDESDILVDTLTLDHTTSGIRIKSNVQRGGTVRNVVYRNVCMRDVEVPLSISPFYNGQTTDGIDDLGLKGPLTPDYKGIALENVVSLTPGVVQVAGLSSEHTTDLLLNGVEVRGVRPEEVKARNANVTVGPKGANFTFRGAGVTSTPTPTPKAHPTLTCEGKFVPYQD